MSETIQRTPALVESTIFNVRGGLQPTAREWVRHSALFLITAITTTMAGVFAIAPEIDVASPPLATLTDYLLFVPVVYVRTVFALLHLAIANPRILGDGLIFSAALLSILTAHEMGHYLACRYYGVSATLPFFVPAPPLFLAGTFGAFIKIRSPIPSRRALFDIGLAGPLAGFVVAIPIAILGILTMRAGAPWSGHGIVFHDPLLFRVIAKLIGVPLDIYAPINPYYLAAWIGLLVTSLNLMPVGQLDGGHGTFAVFGHRAHQRIGQIAFVSMVVLTVLGFWWYGSPSGFLYTILLGIMLRVRHPQPVNTDHLGSGRILIAVVTLIVFALCFWPFPITIS